MLDMGGLPQPIDKAKSQKYAAYWVKEINQAQKDREKFYTRAKKIIQRYRDEKDASASADRSTLGMGVESRSLNLFYSNTETLKPAVYSQRPVPIAERRFLDKDPVGRAASSIWERAIRYEMQSCGFHETFLECRDEFLLPGQGVPWVRYVPQFADSVSATTTGNNEITDGNGKNIDEEGDEVGQIAQEKTWESLAVDFVSYGDFLPLGRPQQWRQCLSLAKRVWMTREDMKLKPEFAETWERIPLTTKQDQDEKNKGNITSSDSEIGEKAEIFEIWCKFDRTVYWVCKEFDELCGYVADPLKLRNFFPCPRPILANKTNDTMIPVPFYIQSQDQYLQINDLTRRIDVLTNACRVIGFYDASEKNITRAFTEGREPQLIPVDQWAMFAERGGSKGMIDFVPIDLMAKTIRELIATRTQLIADLDRVTGVWDILRGETNPNETLGAQQLKQQNGVGRLKELQDEFARLACETIEIMGEIIAEHYSDETLIEVSGAMFDESLQPQNQPEAPNAMMGHNGGPPMNQPSVSAGMAGMGQPGAIPSPVNPPMPPAGPMPSMGMIGVPPPVDPMQEKMAFIMQAIQLLRSDKMRGFRLDIETDSTIQPDANQEKMASVEFLKASVEFMMGAGQIGMANPIAIPLLAKMYQFAARRFRISRDLESSIDEFSEQMTVQAKAAQANPQPSPDQIKADAEKMRTEADMVKAKDEAQMRKVEMAHEDRMKAADEKMKMLDLAIAMASASQDEQGEDGTVTKKANPEIKSMVEGILKQNELMESLQKELKKANAPNRIERDPKGKAIRVVKEEPQEEAQLQPGEGRLGELMELVQGAVGKRTAPREITRDNGQLGIT
jgi:hypothetical protein